MSAKSSRICIYPKDIQMLTAVSYRQACRIHLDIRNKYGMGHQPLLFIFDFCKYYHLDVDEISKRLN